MDPNLGVKLQPYNPIATMEIQAPFPFHSAMYIQTLLPVQAKVQNFHPPYQPEAMAHQPELPQILPHPKVPQMAGIANILSIQLIDWNYLYRWLKLHNNYRVQYKAVPLKWNPTLVAASKRVTDKCLWKHTPNNRYGENIAAGQATMEDVVKGWVAGPDERDSFTGPNSKPSHFTQVVWQATTEVGCYKGMCKSVRGINIPQSPVTFWACTYNPQGNIIGQIGKNVKAAPGGRPL
ncbi:hypothetical protein PGT21_014881 [Puccinia graminis f. sp. tritici]|uniref:SCP domain-containing protein n=1 Tax=Puccinia graminis f. sp. tritici TaxID=56615 RepID=A0A5B0N2J8_PUCGR|nr:hypothetical protein PGT21_014881 [Puccinia graminis f. sp. tritici]KAA1087991.1 hypothetical protein PGTUg99_015205 [Puccinia graminis f. sp. tritici]